MANKVKYGLKKCYYAVATDDGHGVLTYATPVALPGAVSLSLDAQTETSPFYADDIIYFQAHANNGYTGSLELAYIPDSFRTAVLGETADTNSVLVEKSGAAIVEFALLFEFDGDDEKNAHCMYRCTATRPAVAGNTRDNTITPQTETLNLTAMPRLNDQVVKSRCGSDNTTVYASWYSSVYSPTF